MFVRSKIISFFIILLVLFSAPSVFAEAIFFGREIRFFLGITILLLLYQDFYKFQSTQLYIIFFLLFFLFLEIILLRSKLNNIISFHAAIILPLFFFIVSKSNKVTFNIFLDFWLCFSFILSIAAIFSFLIHQFSSIDVDILNFRLSGRFNEIYNYRMSIFGFTMEKNFYVVNVARVCSFFNEPQHAGLFFILNIVLIKTYSNLISKKYFFANFIAGLLTFSLTFYIVYLLVLFLRSKSYQKAIIMVMSLTILLFYIYHSGNNYNLSNELLNFTSYQDRITRDLNAIDILNNASILKLLVGHGFDNYMQLSIDGRAIASGFLNLIFDNGFFILFIFLIILIRFSFRNPILLFVLLTYLILMPWYKFSFCWYVIILAGLNNTGTFRYKNVDKKKKFF
jgi:hypothetical protein